MATALVQARIDSELKKNVEVILNDIGLDTSTAIRVFFKAIINKQGIPFRLSQKRKKSKALDPFYSEENQAFLRVQKHELTKA